MFETFIKLTPVAKGRPRFTRSGVVFTDSKTRMAENLMGACLKNSFRAEPLKGALALDVTFYLKKPKSSKNAHPVVRPDLDNYLKLVSDSANGILWHDDAQICRILSSKVYIDDLDTVGVRIQVGVIDDHLQDP